MLSTLQGFEAVVDSKTEYPLTKRDSVLIRPGHIVSFVTIYLNQSLKTRLSDRDLLVKMSPPLQNSVSLEATKMTPNPNIETISAAPDKRNCYFNYEYSLKSQHQYSYVR